MAQGHDLKAMVRKESWKYRAEVNAAISWAFGPNESRTTTLARQWEIHNLFVEVAARAASRGYQLGLVAGVLTVAAIQWAIQIAPKVVE